jgi:hypothetical protein
MRFDVDLARTPYDLDGELDGAWTQEQLIEMNARFVAALERAFELELESKASAANQVKLPARSSPRWSTPLCSATCDGLLRSAAASVISA